MHLKFCFVFTLVNFSHRKISVLNRYMQLGYIYIEYNVSFLRIILVSTLDQQQYEKNGQKQNEKYEITTLISINTSLARFYIYYFSKSL